MRGSVRRVLLVKEAWRDDEERQEDGDGGGAQKYKGGDADEVDFNMALDLGGWLSPLSVKGSRRVARAWLDVVSECFAGMRLGPVGGVIVRGHFACGRRLLCGGRLGRGFKRRFGG